ncbi:hypothetical protein EXIGLDRAFT_767596 [Exidia glandulosa HHB12029]|uniref:Uncharacterized protein n=1 Tax=Exidia glandulosa HHB12029 TaxID=1314781 RepID=A0A165IVK0_EXIGL|nr:hypothetical protein EXIGLDRAFT_767596 [Exidia glandulosa HHB12029]
MLHHHYASVSRRDIGPASRPGCRICSSGLTRTLALSQEYYELKCPRHELVAVEQLGGQIFFLGVNSSHCTHPACNKRRHSDCVLNLCKAHCIDLPVSCGAHDHDDARHSANVYAFDFRLPVRVPFGFEKVIAEIHYVNKHITVEHEVIAIHGTLCLVFQPEEAHAALRTTNIDPETMTWFDGHEYVSIRLKTTVPVFNGRVRFEVTGNDDMRVAFPLSHFLDMERGLGIYYNKREAGLTVGDAFAAAFPDCAESDADHEFIALLWKAVLDAPEAVTRRYFYAGRTPAGLWARFVQETERASRSPPPALRPLRRRRDDDDDGSDNDPDNNKRAKKKMKRLTQQLDEALIRRPSYMGPPASEAGPSHSHR